MVALEEGLDDTELYLVIFHCFLQIVIILRNWAILLASLRRPDSLDNARERRGVPTGSRKRKRDPFDWNRFEQDVYDFAGGEGGWQRYFRISKEGFDDLVKILRPSLQSNEAMGELAIGDPMTPEVRWWRIHHDSIWSHIFPWCFHFITAEISNSIAILRWCIPFRFMSQISGD